MSEGHVLQFYHWPWLARNNGEKMGASSNLMPRGTAPNDKMLGALKMVQYRVKRENRRLNHLGIPSRQAQLERRSIFFGCTIWNLERKNICLPGRSSFSWNQRFPTHSKFQKGFERSSLSIVKHSNLIISSRHPNCRHLGHIWHPHEGQFQRSSPGQHFCSCQGPGW